MINQSLILDFLALQKELLRNEYQVVKIGLFGSFARNEGTAESDIDIIVEFQPNTTNLTDKKNQIKTLIQEKFDRKVDLCREKYIKPYFKEQILQSVIYV